MTWLIGMAVLVGLLLLWHESYRCGRHRGWLEGQIQANESATERLNAEWEAQHVGPKPEIRPLGDEPIPNCAWCGRPTEHTYIRHLTFVHACDEEHANMSFGQAHESESRSSDDE